MRMEKWQNRKTTRLPGYDYSTEGAYFLTLCTENRQCLLSRIVGTGVPDGPCTHNPSLVGTGVLDGPKIQLLPFGKIAEKYIKQLNDFYDHITVDSYVIMPNHIHILLSVKDRGPSGGRSLQECDITANGPSGRPVTSGPSGTPVPTVQNSVVARFVSTLKRFCNKEYGKNIWQYRSYDHIIRDQRDFDRHLQYIHENPFGWEKDEFYAP